MESFDQLVKQYESMIWKIINSLHIYKNKEEYFQVGLIAMWEAKERFDADKGSFTSYAYSYIKGKIMTELSKSKKHDDNSMFPDEEFWETIKDDKPDRSLEAEFILSFCINLTENQKKWVLYTTIEYLTIKEIAEKEKVSLSAVKAWRKGAKQKLKNNLQIID